MRILVGPPGSGKTHRILEQARARLRVGAADFRLLVPTATMAEHVRNQLAREGFVFRPVLVETLSRFLDPFASDAPQASPKRSCWWLRMRSAAPGPLPSRMSRRCAASLPPWRA